MYYITLHCSALYCTALVPVLLLLYLCCSVKLFVLITCLYFLCLIAACTALHCTAIKCDLHGEEPAGQGLVARGWWPGAGGQWPVARAAKTRVPGLQGHVS
jgi:hypothetical protein